MAVSFRHLRAVYCHGVGLYPQPKLDDARRTLSNGSPRLASTIQRPGQRPGNPTAFTLLELLLVLVVLATLSSIALPRVERMLEKGEHRAAADSLHAALSQLRLKAIQTGRTHSLRFVPGSGIFELRAEGADEVSQLDFTGGDDLAGGAMDTSLEPSGPDDGSAYSGRENASLADWAGADSLTKPVDDSGEFSTEPDSLSGDQVERRQLSDQIWLVSSLDGELTNEGDQRLSSDAGGSYAGGGQEGGLNGELLDASLTNDSTATQWSAPIFFYPDGRASDARFFVIAPSDYTIELTVVGISGKVEVGNRRRLPKGANQLDLSARVQLEPTAE